MQQNSKIPSFSSLLYQNPPQRKGKLKRSKKNDARDANHCPTSPTTPSQAETYCTIFAANVYGTAKLHQSPLISPIKKNKNKKQFTQRGSSISPTPAIHHFAHVVTAPHPSPPRITTIQHSSDPVQIRAESQETMSCD